MSASGVTIPSMILKQLYTYGSLENVENGARFSIKNRLSDTRIVKINSIKIDDKAVPNDQLSFALDDGSILKVADITEAAPLAFPLKAVITVTAAVGQLAPGKHEIEFNITAESFGELSFSVEDAVSEEPEDLTRIPRNAKDDYADVAIKSRQDFVEEFTGKKLEHSAHYSFDPHILQGNIEHFVGVAQIPLGVAGPLQVNGEHAQGEFLIPMATSEGTLVASYNRGIKVLNLCGGVRVTVVGDAMQRAPVFVFNDARAARDFVLWVNENIDDIREQAEATSSVAQLQYVDPYLSNKFVYLRFNYFTGDAAGQNMVGRATFAACSWILDTYDESVIEHFFLESNFATDKKASQVNILHTRGKRVTAEAVIQKDVLEQHMRVGPVNLNYHQKVATVGAFLSGANNNGAHSPNAITAMFIATGQDVANVSESSAGIVYTELTPERDLYVSITIPSLIVATYGGGTGLATQRECLEMMDCYGKGKVNKLAEIVAGVVLAGEISLAAAI